MNIRQMFAGAMEQKGLEFGLNISISPPEIIILDEVRLKQILMNIVGNAVKFTDKGGASPSLLTIRRVLTRPGKTI